MTRPTYGSLFSGVGGMDMGFDTHMDCVFQVEWDKHAQSILRRHWPDVPKWGDVQEVNGADLPPCDVLTFGSPCQDLSIAGKRAGLDGDRSSMFYEAVRIIKEMRDATNNVYPRITVWENVPEPYLPTEVKTLVSSSMNWHNSGRWRSNGECWMHSTSESPSDGGACSSSLSSILQPPSDVPTRYYLSAKAAEGILRRAERRGKTLPEALRQALLQVAHTVSSDTATTSKTTPPPL